MLVADQLDTSIGSVSIEGFEARVIERDPVVVRLTGDLDAVSAPALAQLFADAVQAGAKELELEAADLSFIDSQGLNALMQARRHGPHLRLRSASPELLRLLELAGLRDLLPLDEA